ncbi:MAG: FAD/NAD(P)-binding protein [Bacteriovorax sp.]|jgi:hypothetical protein
MPTKTAKSKLTRRDFAKILGLSSVAGLLSVPGFLALKRKTKKYNIPGSIMGANSRAGHLLRSKIETVPTKTVKMKTVIVGGGIAGMSAAWKLKKNNDDNFVLLEMDSRTGGNSQSDENEISKYPWGAHYVPIPNMYDLNIKELFEDFGIITGYEKNLPVINEYYLCSDPEERLFYQGKWQDGLIPTNGVTESDRNQYNQFFNFVDSLKGKKGKDGKLLFAIPLDLSSQDTEYLALDKISISDYMLSRNWDSKPLHWYVDYCCRDDFGVSSRDVSAWAGIHYFASRIGLCANSDSQRNITWPEGNGWLADKLKNFSSNHINCNQLAYNIEIISPEKAYVDVLNPVTNEFTRYEAQNIIYCGPRFTADKVIKDQNFKSSKNLIYSPWLTANISLKQKPRGEGHQLSWDNVSYYSDSLGYIVATHQDLKFNHNETVITYYLPLDKLSILESRHAAYLKSYDDWLDLIIPDLQSFHSNILQDITKIDLWIWGHGMISPSINYLWSEEREQMKKPIGPVQFAHTDMSGISIFEEALYHGCNAANNILRKA